jgi:hypothetical protein
MTQRRARELCPAVVGIVDAYENHTRLPHDVIPRRWLVVVMEAMLGGELYGPYRRKKIKKK